MKNIFSLIIALGLILPAPSYASLVKGHFTKKGKYVKTHYRKSLKRYKK